MTNLKFMNVFWGVVVALIAMCVFSVMFFGCQVAYPDEVKAGDLVEYFGGSGEHLIGTVKTVEEWEKSSEQSIEVDFMGYFPTGYLAGNYEGNKFQWSKMSVWLLSSWVNLVDTKKFTYYVSRGREWSVNLYYNKLEDKDEKDKHCTLCGEPDCNIVRHLQVGL